MCGDNKEKELWRLYERTRLDRQYLADGLISLMLLPEAKIVDVGCGSGGSTQIARECYAQADIYGVDCSVEAIQYASKILKNKNISLIRADATCMPFPSNYFDCCIAKMVFDITASGEKILGEMVRVLKPGGMLLIYGNTRSTAQGSKLLKNADKMIRAYERYVRLSGRKGFDVEYLTKSLEQEYEMTVRVQRIVKDTINTGRAQLVEYYALTESEMRRCADDNILSRLGLISPDDVIGYETSLKKLLLTSDEYLAFEQAILYATKERER